MPTPTVQDARTISETYSKAYSQSDIDQKNVETVIANRRKQVSDETARTYGGNISPEALKAEVDTKMKTEVETNTAIKDAIAKHDTSHLNETAAQQQLQNLASTDAGKDALRKAGYSEDQITAISSLGVSPGATAAVKGAVDQLYGPSGFENPNTASHTPFYYQFPTLEAISEFHLRNGFGPYGENPDTTAIARDAVHFQVYSVVPPAWKAEYVPGSGNLIRNSIDSATTKTLGTFTIYPNNPDNLSMDHVHTYSDDNAIANVINGLLDTVNGAESIIAGGAAALKTLNSGEELSVSQRVNRRLDTINIYQSSAKAKITIPFVLFTRQDFLRDVFQPLMILTALSYPKRKLYGNLGSLTEDFGDELKITSTDLIGKSSPKLNEAISAIADQLKGAGATIQNVEKYFATNVGAGPFRYFVSQRPEYLSVRHASGLYYYPLIYIEKFSYNFKGPWYNFQGNIVDYSDGFESSFNNALNSPKSFAEAWTAFGDSASEAGSNITQAFSSSPPKPSPQEQRNQDLYAKNKLPFAYPSYAECNISIASALPSFRDDFLQMLQNSRKGGQDLVTLSQRETGQIQQQKTASNTSKGI